MKNKKVYTTTLWLTCTAMLTALVVVMGYIPGIPVVTGKIYWCDFAIYMAAYLMDPISAAIVGGVGTTFFDLFGINGTAYNAIPSLIIHGLQGFTASFIFLFMRKLFLKDGGNRREGVLAVISSLLPAVIVILGYFIKRITWEKLAPEVAVLKMPANVLQEIVGVAVAVVICFVCRLKKQLTAAHLLPEFRRKVIEEPPEEKDGEN